MWHSRNLWISMWAKKKVDQSQKFFQFLSHLNKKNPKNHWPSTFQHTEPIKVNQEFSLSISGSFFWLWTRIFIQVSNLRFTSCINFSLFSAIGSISGFSQQLLIVNSLVSYKAQMSNLKFWTFSQLSIARIMGCKTQVFKFQFLTRPNISFSRFLNFWPEKGYFLVYFNKPYIF